MEALTGLEVLFAVIGRFWPVWLCLAGILIASYATRQRTGLYGKLFSSGIGVVGFCIVVFWLLTVIFADAIATHPALEQFFAIKNKPPGAPMLGASEDAFGWALLGGDNLGRDVFSRVVYGARIVLPLAFFATSFGFLAGIILGLPSGYLGGRTDTILTFLANLILAFPVILLFYLLVTKEIRDAGYAITLWNGDVWMTSIPNLMGAVFFLFPIVFLLLLWNSRFHVKPRTNYMYLGVTAVLGAWVYIGLTFDADPFGLISISPEILTVFVAVVFVNSPGVYRIVRGLTLDVKTRDYVSSAQTRGEGFWYIMLWEILPNVRGPLIVDFCLRIGYTTILLGTLGFFGLGLESESPDWGSTINNGRKLLTIYAHPALVPALALMSLVLGLNLLADGLREQSLKD